MVVPIGALSYDLTLEAMRRLAARIAKMTADYREPGHPIDINFTLEPEYLRAAAEVSREGCVASSRRKADCYA